VFIGGECAYVVNVCIVLCNSQKISSTLSKFIVNSIMFMSLNKFTIKIYFITNLMVLNLYHEYLFFLRNFSQSLNYLVF
jgi:hypothetical protein